MDRDSICEGVAEPSVGDVAIDVMSASAALPRRRFAVGKVLQWDSAGHHDGAYAAA